jgi:hypothetical protein
MVKSVLIGKRLRPVTAAAEVDVKKDSMKVRFRVAVPGINNRAVPMAINAINPMTNCKATGNWRERPNLATPLYRITRCRPLEAPVFGLLDWVAFVLLIPGC